MRKCKKKRSEQKLGLFLCQFKKTSYLRVQFVRTKLINKYTINNEQEFYVLPLFP